MAIFKVGQKARVINPDSRFLGREVTIIGALHWARIRDLNKNHSYRAEVYSADIPGEIPPAPFTTPWCFLPGDLAPLTDPRASEFIADMNRFSKLSENSHA